MTEKIYDVIIIGAGPAGLTAAIYTRRKEKETIIFESQFAGGKAGTAHKVDNYPGFPYSISGMDLVMEMRAHALKFEPILKESTEIIKFNLKDKIKSVATRKGEIYKGYSVIICIGSKTGKLNLPREEELIGKGVSYCATCDGPFFRNKNVAVIGDGYEAIREAIYLADVVNDTYLISPKGTLTGDEMDLDMIKDKNIKTLMNTEVKQILGDEKVKALKLFDNSKNEEIYLDVDGIFIALESAPTSLLLKNAGIEVDEKGFILVDRKQKTNIDGVYAAGDCTGGLLQIVTATGEGAIAGYNAAIYASQLKRTLNKT
ncbi:MAG: NAD(P)/FAD-dependent oxidoreductase [Candidatus Helarchaeota archaeon]